MTLMKLRCHQCNWLVPESDFVRNKSKPGGRDTECLDCKRHREWARKFGLTWEDYASMLHSQGGVCAICLQEESRTRNGKPRCLSVDHDHITGRVRGLLCSLCNSALGYLRDRPKLAALAIVYLLESEERQQWYAKEPS